MALGYPVKGLFDPKRLRTTHPEKRLHGQCVSYFLDAAAKGLTMVTYGRGFGGAQGLSLPQFIMSWEASRVAD